MKIFSRENQGVFYALASGLLYGLIGYFGVSIIQANHSVFNMLFWRFLVSALLMVVPLIFLYKKNGESYRGSLKMFMAGGAFYATSTILYFFASQYIGTGLAIVLFFTYPAIVMLLDWYFKGIKPATLYYFAIVMIVAGLMLLTDLSSVSFSLIGIGLTMLSAAAYASYVVVSNNVSSTPLMTTVVVSLGCAATCFAGALIDSSFCIPTTLGVWWNVFGFAVIGTAIPILLMLEALKIIGSAKAAILSVLEPIVVVIVGVVLLHELINVRQVMGIIVVLSGALITLKTKSKKS